jgi:hypothetical protein
VTLKSALTDAIRYWEWRRLLYNGVLAAIVLVHFILAYPRSSQKLSADLLQGVFVLAVVANMCYCAAYFVDIPAQLSDFRDSWLKYRWVLLVVGILFAAIFARFFSLGFFA